MDKKGMMSIDIIIAISIGLIIFVLIIFMVTDGFKNYDGALTKCEGAKMACKSTPPTSSMYISYKLGDNWCKEQHSGGNWYCYQCKPSADGCTKP